MKPTKHEYKVAVLVVAIVLIFFSVLLYIVISAESRPRPKLKLFEPYDKVEVFGTDCRSAFRTPDGWYFAGRTGQDDCTVFIQKRVKK